MQTKIIELIHLWQIPLLILFALPACKKDENPCDPNKSGTKNLHGKVIDATTGVGIPNCKVEVVQMLGGGGSPGVTTVKNSAITDVNGNYSINYEYKGVGYNFTAIVSAGDSYKYFDRTTDWHFLQICESEYKDYALYPKGYMKVHFKNTEPFYMIGFGNSGLEGTVSFENYIYYDTIIFNGAWKANSNQLLECGLYDTLYNWSEFDVPYYIESFDTTTIYITYP